MRREEIKKIALEHFSTKGYHDTSMQEIADEIGIKKASLYYHFNSKSALFLETLNDTIHTFVEKIKFLTENPSPNVNDIESRIKNMFMAYINEIPLSVIVLWKRTLLMSTYDYDIQVQQDAYQAILARDIILFKIADDIIRMHTNVVSNENLTILTQSISTLIRGFTESILLLKNTYDQNQINTLAENVWQCFWNGIGNQI